MTANSKILKVCKVDSLNFASYAMKQNVNFLGVHILYPKNMGEHLELIRYIHKHGGRPIIVTYIGRERPDEDIKVLIELVNLYNPFGLQLHYDLNPSIITTLRATFPDLLLFGVFTDASKVSDYHLIDSLIDYLVYDTSFVGGTGSETGYSHFDEFPESLKLKTLLAGGINLHRISKLSNLGAAGFDMQSYFRENVEINFRRLNNICDLLRFPRRNMLSISLTDVELTDIWNAGLYYLHNNLEYHLDYSNGSLYNKFNTIGRSIEEKQLYLNQLPYSFHLFIKENEGKDEIKKAVQKLYNKHPLSLTRFFVQYYPEINSSIYSDSFEGQIKLREIKYRNSEGEQVDSYWDRINIRILPSIFYKDLQHFLSREIDAPVISIVVPLPDEEPEWISFLSTLDKCSSSLADKEIWFDRNLNFKYIKLIQENFRGNANFIVGKNITSDWSKLNSFYEQIHQQVRN